MGSGLSVIGKKTMVEHLDFDNHCIFVFRLLALIVSVPSRQLGDFIKAAFVTNFV